jgi:hypothetical protein
MATTFTGDLANLVTIQSINPRGSRQQYHLRYTESEKSDGRFKLSGNAFETLGIENNALILRREPKTGEVLLVTVPDARTADDARPPQEAFMNRRFYSEDSEKAGEAMGKGDTFKATRLRDELVELYGENVTDYAFDHVGAINDTMDAYFVRPWTEEDVATTIDAVTDETPSTKEVEDKEEAEETKDAFDLDI